MDRTAAARDSRMPQKEVFPLGHTADRSNNKHARTIYRSSSSFFSSSRNVDTSIPKLAKSSVAAL